MAQKGPWNLATEKILRERGALPKEKGDAVREYNAMHEENFSSSCLREDGRENEERTAKMSCENEEEKRGKDLKKGRKKRTKRRLLK